MSGLISINKWEKLAAELEAAFNSNMQLTALERFRLNVMFAHMPQEIRKADITFFKDPERYKSKYSPNEKLDIEKTKKEILQRAKVALITSHALRNTFPEIDNS